MDRLNVIKLISITQTQDTYGVWRETLAYRQVYCRVQSVSRSEFFEAGRSGLNPEFVFTVFFGDYDGETLLEFDGKTYSIYRTYHTRSNMMELYAERKGGSNGKEESEGNQPGQGNQGNP